MMGEIGKPLHKSRELRCPRVDKIRRTAEAQLVAKKLSL
jgi:hypothetical protein